MRRLSRGLVCVVMMGLLATGCSKKPDNRKTEAGGGQESAKDTEITDANQLALARQASESYIIEPGVGMGRIKLGKEAGKIEDILGTPEFKSGDIYQYPGIAVVVREGKVYGIWCGDAKGTDSMHYRACPCRTKEGIGMGSSEQDVIAAYGQPEKTRQEQMTGGVMFGYLSKGMMIGLKDGKVYLIIAQTPRQ